MMRCDEAQRSLSEYIDGVLPDETAKLVEQHLSDCPGCREICDSIREIAGYMSEMERVDPPADFVERVNARLDAKKSFAASLRRMFTPVRIKLPLELAGVAAAVVLIFYVAQFNLREKPSDDTAPAIAVETGLEEPERAGRADPGGRPGDIGEKDEAPPRAKSKVPEGAGTSQDLSGERIESPEKKGFAVSGRGADSEGASSSEDQDPQDDPAVGSIEERAQEKESDAPVSVADDAREVKEDIVQTATMRSSLIRQPRRMDVDSWRLRIDALGGRIIDIQPPGGVSNPDSAAVPIVFSIEIPTKNHLLFLTELEKFKSIEKISTEVTGVVGDTLKIRMVIEDLSEGGPVKPEPE